MRVVEQAAFSHAGSAGRSRADSEESVARWLAWCRILEANGSKRPEPADVPRLQRSLPLAAKEVNKYIALRGVCTSDAERRAAMSHLDPLCSAIAERAASPGVPTGINPFARGYPTRTAGQASAGADDLFVNSFPDRRSAFSGERGPAIRSTRGCNVSTSISSKPYWRSSVQSQH